MWNATKHSGADWIRVCVEQVDDQVRVTVTDDGVGFDSKLGGDGEHFGLQMMTERVETAGGRVEVESQLGSGTVVVATVPARLWDALNDPSTQEGPW